MTAQPDTTELRAAIVGELVHDRGSEPHTGWFIVAEGGYVDVDNARWVQDQDGDTPWTSEHFDLYGTIPALVDELDTLRAQVAAADAREASIRAEALIEAADAWASPIVCATCMYVDQWLRNRARVAVRAAAQPETEETQP